MYANRNKQLTVVIGITLTLLAGLGGCSKIEPVTNNLRPALAYRIGTISGVETDLYPGEIRARQEADHAFRISGKMVARLVDAGSVVKRGQPLARLDPQDTKLAADATNANAAAAETEATFADAESRRFKDLFAKGFVSQSALDQKLNVANAAPARLESARAQASVARPKSVKLKSSSRLRSKRSMKVAASNPEIAALKLYEATSTPNSGAPIANARIRIGPSGIMIMKSRM